MHHSFCIDRLQWGSTVGHPSNSWASCSLSDPAFSVPRLEFSLKLIGPYKWINVMVKKRKLMAVLQVIVYFYTTSTQ